MTSNVYYRREHRSLDLAALSQADYELVISLHGKIRHGDQTLICEKPGGNNGEMFIRRLPGSDIYRSVHFAGGAHGSHEIAEPETPEHERQKEYWARAASHHGYTATQEVPVKGAGVMDVTITDCACPTDIEVQHSPIPAAQVKTRTTRYRKAGYLPVWFNDKGNRPTWLAEVPALGCNERPWDVLPGRGVVTATGLGALRVVSCSLATREFDGRCPQTGGRMCGRTHALVTAGRGGLSVDDVAGMIPAGQLVPLRYRNGNVFLVSPEDFARYQDDTGGLGDWSPGGKPARVRGYRQQPDECWNPVHDSPVPSSGLVLAPPRPDPLPAPGREVTGQRAWTDPVPRERRPTAGRRLCPCCNEAELTNGRTRCQTCGLLGRPIPVG
jgi:hypothetical protein